MYFINLVRKWFISTFLIINRKDAIIMGLIFCRNIYGDEINVLNGARSIWKDPDREIYYRVSSLEEDSYYSRRRYVPPTKIIEDGSAKTFIYESLDKSVKINWFKRLVKLIRCRNK